MHLFLGYNLFERNNGKDVKIWWDSEKSVNHHMLLMGGSGSGKTYLLRNIIEQLKKQDNQVRFHIFDYHNDIEVSDASSVKFSESTGYGFNPLIVNADPDFGGVRKKVQSFIAALNRTGRPLGSKQEACLRNLLTDLYAANGFYLDKPESWLLEDGVQRKYPKKHPTLTDALKFSMFKLNALSLGSNNKSMALLEQLNKTVSRFYVKQKSFKKATTIDEIEKIKLDIEELKIKAIETYTDYINSIQTGSELSDLVKYDSKDVMKSVVERLENLSSIGIFRDKLPPFDPNKNVWRYQIGALLADEKKLFVNFVLEQIFYRRFQEGVQDSVREFIVIDEADVYFSEDADNIINIIAKEARKFGIGLICASQSPTHFSDDFMSNVAFKAVLGIDSMFWSMSERKLNIPMKYLSAIKPQTNMLVQIKNKGETQAKFTPCLFK